MLVLKAGKQLHLTLPVPTLPYLAPPYLPYLPSVPCLTFLQAGKQLQNALRADAGNPGSSDLPTNLAGDADAKVPDEIAPADKEGATAAVPAAAAGGSGETVATVAGGPDGGAGEEDLLLAKAADEEDDLCEPYEVT